MILLTGQPTENLHCEKQTGASSHVGDDTTVMAAVLRFDLLYLQVLPSCQPLESTAQLMKQEEGRKKKCDYEELFAGNCLYSLRLYLHFGLILVPLYIRCHITVRQALQGEMSINCHPECLHITRAKEGRWG